MSNLSFPDFKTATFAKVIDWVKNGDLESVKNLYDVHPNVMKQTPARHPNYSNEEYTKLELALRERIYGSDHEVTSFIEAHASRDITEDDLKKLKEIMAHYNTGTFMVTFWQQLVGHKITDLLIANLKKTHPIMSVTLVAFMSKMKC